MDELAAVINEARKQGYRVEQTRNGHWEFKSPDRTRRPVYAAGTPSDWRAIRNLIAELRRAGFRWDPAERRKKTKEKV